MKNLSSNSVDTLSFDNISLETDIAQGIIFKSKRTGMIHNLTKDVDSGYIYRKTQSWYGNVNDGK